MNILVTGATGFLGREVVARLSQEHNVTGLGHRHGGPDIRQVDIRDRAAFRQAIEAAAPDLVVHGAAYREPDFCERQPEECARLNVETVRTLCDTLPPAAHLAFVSTDYVFDGAHPPYREDSPRSPINEYGRSKVRAEDLALARPNSLVLRIPLLVGAGPTFEESGFLAEVVRRHLDDRSPQPCDDALIRHPTWIRDVAEALAFLVARGAEGVVHYGGDEALTRYGMVVAAARALGRPSDHLSPSTAAVARPAARPPDSHLATDRIRAMGFARFTPFAEVVRAFAARFPAETAGRGAPARASPALSPSGRSASMHPCGGGIPST
jgi:dTDP-4-dehydrorhamnose reductase